MATSQYHNILGHFIDYTYRQLKNTFELERNQWSLGNQYYQEGFNNNVNDILSANKNTKVMYRSVKYIHNILMLF